MFAKLQKVTISFVLSVCPSICVEQLSSDWTDFHLIFEDYFKNLSRKFKCHENWTGIKGTLHEDQNSFLIIFHLFLLRMRYISERNYRENQNTHFVFSNLFSKIVLFMR